MNKIMFNDKYGLTLAVLNGNKTQTRRIPNYNISFDHLTKEQTCELARFKIGEVVAIAQSYNTIFNNCQSDPNSAIKKVEICKSFKNFIPGKLWNNKMFVRPSLMPHHVKVTDIRIEKIQDISDNDCLSEGILKIGEKYSYYGSPHSFDTPKEAYESLIKKIGKKSDWDNNPKVLVYNFELVD